MRIWAVGGNWRSQRKPRQARGERSNSTQKGHGRPSGSDAEPSFCDATVLKTAPPQTLLHIALHLLFFLLRDSSGNKWETQDLCVYVDVHVYVCARGEGILMELVSTFRDLGVGINSNTQLASDNDRVFDDLWRKDNMPTVLNNPYSESDKVEQDQSLPHAHDHTDDR